jgi:hypothetical protein
MGRGVCRARKVVARPRRMAWVVDRFFARPLLVMFACVWMQVAMGEEYPQPDLSEVRAMNACGSRYLNANTPDAIIPVLQRKQLVEPFKQALLRVTSPYSTGRDVVAKLDAREHDAVGALLFVTSAESLRARAMVDRTSFNAIHYVLMYYMAQAAGNEGGPDCAISPLTREWMDGMAFSKFELRPDISGVPFALLDSQQVDLNVCTAKAAGKDAMRSEHVARLIAADPKRASALEGAAFAALASPELRARLQALDSIPEEIFRGTGLTGAAERRVYSLLEILGIVSTSDPDYRTRLKARLLLEYYRMLVLQASCALPQESKHLIESLHVDH